MKRILVFGSLNLDLVQSVPRLPQVGETLSGGGLATFVGGKGANQAYAAARLGGEVAMLGKVGRDGFEERIVRELQSAGVQTSLVASSHEPTGTAVILVLPDGDNSIVISAGANADIPEDFAVEAIGNLSEGDILLVQLETPMPAVHEAVRKAHRKGMTVILDPAPARAVPHDLLSMVSILTPNQTETALLLGQAEPPLTVSEAAGAARALRERGVRSVIVKMGAGGCWVQDGGDGWAVPGHPVNAVDTTAAGDTFSGGLTAALARGETLAAAVRFANAAAALSVTRMGAIASIPDRAAVDEFLQSQSTLQ